MSEITPSVRIMTLAQTAIADLARAHHSRRPSEHEIRNKDIRGTISERKTVPFVVYKEGPAKDFLTHWRMQLSEVEASVAALPPGTKASLQIDASGLFDSEYGLPPSEIELQWDRPETDDEWAERKADVERRAALELSRVDAKDRAEFERLKTKFGVNS